MDDADVGDGQLLVVVADDCVVNVLLSRRGDGRGLRLLEDGVVVDCCV